MQTRGYDGEVREMNTWEKSFNLQPLCNTTVMAACTPSTLAETIWPVPAQCCCTGGSFIIASGALYRIPIAICVMSDRLLSHCCRGVCWDALCKELGIHIAIITVIGHIYPSTITILLEIDLCPLWDSQDDSTVSAGVNPQTQISGGGSYYAFCKGNKGSTHKYEY